jgi:hypothetical protein
VMRGRGGVSAGAMGAGVDSGALAAGLSEGGALGAGTAVVPNAAGGAGGSPWRAGACGHGVACAHASVNAAVSHAAEGWEQACGSKVNWASRLEINALSNTVAQRLNPKPAIPPSGLPALGGTLREAVAIPISMHSARGQHIR